MRKNSGTIDLWRLAKEVYEICVPMHLKSFCVESNLEWVFYSKHLFWPKTTCNFCQKPNLKIKFLAAR